MPLTQWVVCGSFLARFPFLPLLEKLSPAEALQCLPCPWDKAPVLGLILHPHEQTQVLSLSLGPTHTFLVPASARLSHAQVLTVPPKLSVLCPRMPPPLLQGQVQEPLPGSPGPWSRPLRHCSLSVASSQPFPLLSTGLSLMQTSGAPL